MNVLVCDNIIWGEKFSLIFNGKAAIQNEWFESLLVSDSSRKGFAAYVGNDWIAGTWDNSMCVDTPCNHIAPYPVLDAYDDSNINVLELWPVVKGLQRWCSDMKDRKVESITDNMQVFYILKTGLSKNVTFMFWLCELFWICVIYDITLSPSYIPSEENCTADLVSRLAYAEYAKEGITRLTEYGLCCTENLLNYWRFVVGGIEEKDHQLQEESIV